MLDLVGWNTLKGKEPESYELIDDDWEPEIEGKIIWIHIRNLKSKIKKIWWELDYYRRELVSVRLIKIIEEKENDWQIKRRE